MKKLQNPINPSTQMNRNFAQDNRIEIEPDNPAQISNDLQNTAIPNSNIQATANVQSTSITQTVANSQPVSTSTNFWTKSFSWAPLAMQG